MIVYDFFFVCVLCVFGNSQCSKQVFTFQRLSVIGWVVGGFLLIGHLRFSREFLLENLLFFQMLYVTF